MKKLKVGIIIDDLLSNQYVFDLVNFISENENFEDPVLISGYKINNSKNFLNKLTNKFQKNPFKLINNILKGILFKFIKVIEIRIVKKRYPKFQTYTDISSFNEFEMVEVNAFKSEYPFVEFTHQDLKLLTEKSLDCIVHCGSGILKGEILNVPKFGVITYESKEALGFSEVVNGDPSSIFEIKKLSHEGSKEEILFNGSLMTSNIWLANNTQLIEKSNIFLMKLLLDISIHRKLIKSNDPKLITNKLHEINSTSILLKYLLRVIFPKIFNSIISKILSPNVIRYSVAYAYHEAHTKKLEYYKEVINPKGRFLADPFAFEHDNHNYIFVEDLFFNDNKGRISVLKIVDNKYEFLGVVLEEDFHLSFPFIFRENDEIYMIPESHEHNDIRLYKCLEFPYKWDLDHILMSDISAADTMIINKENTWFMLTNICSAGLSDHQSELHIFYSNKLKSNSWHPIASGNPVIFDSLKGRNGGLFYHENKIYRVNQAHGQAHYGKSFDINEIISLTKDKYEEKECLNINADFKNAIISTHSFNANASLAVIDFARHQRLRKALKT